MSEKTAETREDTLRATVRRILREEWVGGALNQQGAIDQACRLQAAASVYLGDYSEPNDCFCSKAVYHDPRFRNLSRSLRFVRQCLERAIERGETLEEA